MTGTCFDSDSPMRNVYPGLLRRDWSCVIDDRRVAGGDVAAQQMRTDRPRVKAAPIASPHSPASRSVPQLADAW